MPNLEFQSPGQTPSEQGFPADAQNSISDTSKPGKHFVDNQAGPGRGRRFFDRLTSKSLSFSRVPDPAPGKEKELDNSTKSNKDERQRVEKYRMDACSEIDDLIPQLSGTSEERLAQIDREFKFNPAGVMAVAEDSSTRRLVAAVTDELAAITNWARWGPTQFKWMLDEFGLQGDIRGQILRQYYRTTEGLIRNGNGNLLIYQAVEADPDYKKWQKEHPRNRIPAPGTDDERRWEAYCQENLQRSWVSANPRDLVETWMDEISHIQAATPQERLDKIIELVELADTESVDKNREILLSSMTNTIGGWLDDAAYSPNQINAILREFNLGRQLEGQVRNTLYTKWESRRIAHRKGLYDPFDPVSARMRTLDNDPDFQKWTSAEAVYDGVTANIEIRALVPGSSRDYRPGSVTLEEAFGVSEEDSAQELRKRISEFTPGLLKTGAFLNPKGIEILDLLDYRARPVLIASMRQRLDECVESGLITPATRRFWQDWMREDTERERQLAAQPIITSLNEFNDLLMDQSMLHDAQSRISLRELFGSQIVQRRGDVEGVVSKVVLELAERITSEGVTPQDCAFFRYLDRESLLVLKKAVADQFARSPVFARREQGNWVGWFARNIPPEQDAVASFVADAEAGARAAGGRPLSLSDEGGQSREEAEPAREAYPLGDARNPLNPQTHPEVFKDRESMEAALLTIIKEAGGLQRDIIVTDMKLGAVFDIRFLLRRLVDEARLPGARESFEDPEKGVYIFRVPGSPGTADQPVHILTQAGIQKVLNGEPIDPSDYADYRPDTESRVGVVASGPSERVESDVVETVHPPIPQRPSEPGYYLDEANFSTLASHWKSVNTPQEVEEAIAETVDALVDRRVSFVYRNEAEKAVHRTSYEQAIWDLGLSGKYENRVYIAFGERIAFYQDRGINIDNPKLNPDNLGRDDAAWIQGEALTLSLHIEPGVLQLPEELRKYGEYFNRRETKVIEPGEQAKETPELPPAAQTIAPEAKVESESPSPAAILNSVEEGELSLEDPAVARKYTAALLQAGQLAYTDVASIIEANPDRNNAAMALLRHLRPTMEERGLPGVYLLAQAIRESGADADLEAKIKLKAVVDQVLEKAGEYQTTMTSLPDESQRAAATELSTQVLAMIRADRIPDAIIAAKIARSCSLVMVFGENSKLKKAVTALLKS